MAEDADPSAALEDAGTDSAAGAGPFTWDDLPAVLRRRLSADGRQPSAEVLCNLFADRADL